MKTVRSLAELNKALMKELSAAMKEAEYMAIGDMKEGTEVFYSGGSPKRYHRTGALGMTPKTSDFSLSSGGFGGQASFKAYLDQSGGYTTGKRPSMATVLRLANYGNVSGYRPTVGTKGFWEYSLAEMEDSFYAALADHFG